MTAALPLPAQVQNSLRVNWHLTSWCNYSCAYCPVMVFHQRSRSRQVQPHAFDHYSVEQWLEGIRRFNAPDMHLKISGGEPFLDRNNFRDLLDGLSRMPQILVGVDTNGFWDPDHFRGLDKSRLFLNVAFHPTQVPFSEFHPRLLRIRDAGFRIPIVNFVLAPENLDEFDHVFSTLESDGFFVNVSSMISTGVYLSRTERSEREWALIERYNTPLDNRYKIAKPDTLGRPCFYPAMTYYIMYDGVVRVACLDEGRNLITEGLPALPGTAVPCPHRQCIGCSDMYRGLADEPLYRKPLKLFTLIDYAEEVQEWRRERAQPAWKSRLPLKLGRLFGGNSSQPLVERHPEPPPPPLIPPGAIGMALPSAAVFGHTDNAHLAARSRDRVSISGWAASRRHGAPVREVRLRVNDREIGVVRDFFSRPDVAVQFARPDLAQCGWRTMVYLPTLAYGQHALVPRAIDADGQWADLPGSTVTVAD